mmetsp:Transcript_6535/g.26950  ORF Transcript_6535/g.26950 Transcript_6535/m.26950 type:complete len:299 (-) Transcript_6535:463-1359(-)
MQLGSRRLGGAVPRAVGVEPSMQLQPAGPGLGQPDGQRVVAGVLALGASEHLAPGLQRRFIERIGGAAHLQDQGVQPGGGCHIAEPADLVLLRGRRQAAPAGPVDVGDRGDPGSTPFTRRRLGPGCGRCGLGRRGRRLGRWCNSSRWGRGLGAAGGEQRGGGEAEQVAALHRVKPSGTIACGTAPRPPRTSSARTPPHAAASWPRPAGPGPAAAGRAPRPGCGHRPGGNRPAPWPPGPTARTARSRSCPAPPAGAPSGPSAPGPGAGGWRPAASRRPPGSAAPSRPSRIHSSASRATC